MDERKFNELQDKCTKSQEMIAKDKSKLEKCELKIREARSRAPKSYIVTEHSKEVSNLEVTRGETGSLSFLSSGSKLMYKTHSMGSGYSLSASKQGYRTVNRAAIE